jgi:hypothetical protein
MRLEHIAIPSERDVLQAAPDTLLFNRWNHEPHACGARPIRMSNRTFLALVGAVIIVLVGIMALRKMEACAELGGKACPLPRSYVPQNQ